MKNGKGFLISFFLLFLVSCNWSDIPAPTPTETTLKLATQAPHIRGTITHIYSKDGQISGFFVEGALDQDTMYEKAIVGIDGKTLVYCKQDGIYEQTTVTDLSENSQVEVLFTGPILTSDPVQAIAEEIVIRK